MKTKFLFLLPLALSVISCSSYRDFMSIEDRYVAGEPDPLVEGKYLSVFINESPVMLLFDTGAQRSVISDLKAIGGEEILNSEKYKSMSTVVLPNGNKVKLGLLKLDSLSINSVQSKNRKLMVVTQQQQFQCRDTDHIQNQGYYGIENLSEAALPVVLDYSNNTMSLIATPDMNGFKEVDAFFKRNHIGVRLTIKGTPINLLFDTGNTGGIILVKDKLPFKDLNIDYEADVLNLLGDQSLAFLKMARTDLDDVTSGELSFKRLGVMLTNDITHHNMGLEFINQFDWIIDFKNKRLYARPHQVQSLTPSYDRVPIPYLVVPSNNQLMISYRKTNTGSFQIGDVIVQIDDSPITSENICYWFETLNRTSDWSKYNIKSRPAQ